MGAFDLRIPMGGYRICVNESANNITGTFLNGDVVKERRNPIGYQFYIELYKSIGCEQSSLFASMDGHAEPLSEEDREGLLSDSQNVRYLFKTNLSIHNLDADYAVSLLNSLKGLLKTAEAGIGRHFVESEFSVLVSMKTEDVLLMLQYYNMLEKLVMVDVTFGKDYILIK